MYNNIINKSFKNSIIHIYMIWYEELEILYNLKPKFKNDNKTNRNAWIII